MLGGCLTCGRQPEGAMLRLKGRRHTEAAQVAQPRGVVDSASKQLVVQNL